MAQLDPYQFIYIGTTPFEEVEPNHSVIGCAGCHGGVPLVTAKGTTNADYLEAAESAHVGVIHDPSDDPFTNCAGSTCHTDITERYEHSMHNALWGEQYKVAVRVAGEGATTLADCPVGVEEKFNGECGSCHTTCGQCHISRPNSVHGGFISRHSFQRIPDMKNNCTACHGSRIGTDYFGELEGNIPDVHDDNAFHCLDCHNEDLHGNGDELANPPRSRYELEDLPSCLDCHSIDIDDNLFHNTHWPNENPDDGADLSCYVCHSQKYNNCNSCHTEAQWKGNYGEVPGETDVHSGDGNYLEYPDFRIGVNPAYGNDASWSPSLETHRNSKWILLRHIPISRDTYQPWNVGIDELVNYDVEETWEYTSPHNLRRWTERTLADSLWLDGSSEYQEDSCSDNCHYHANYTMGNPINQDIYLTQEFIEENYPDEIDANMDVSLNSSACYDFDCHAERTNNIVQQMKESKIRK